VLAPVWDEFIRDADKDGLTAGEALERAMSAYVAIRQSQRDGALFVLVAPDGTMERLAFDEDG
jgi:hypothetical protein